jgi:hypothetical protein
VLPVEFTVRVSRSTVGTVLPVEITVRVSRSTVGTVLPVEIFPSNKGKAIQLQAWTGR